MKKKKLKKEIKRLNRIIDRQNDFIDEQNVLIQQLRDNYFNYVPFNLNDADVCSDGGDHDYPFPWHSVTAPNCKKCGKQAPEIMLTFGAGNSTGNQYTTYSTPANWENLNSLLK